MFLYSFFVREQSFIINRPKLFQDVVDHVCTSAVGHEPLVVETSLRVLCWNFHDMFGLLAHDRLFDFFRLGWFAKCCWVFADTVCCFRRPCTCYQYQVHCSFLYVAASLFAFLLGVTVTPRYLKPAFKQLLDLIIGGLLHDNVLLFGYFKRLLVSHERLGSYKLDKVDYLLCHP